MHTKKQFYIIGHNPNSIEEADEFLAKGANAIEPDIVYADNTFYVCHQQQLSYENTPTLESYLAGLKEILAEKKYNLALIIWDLKTTDFDPNEFISLVKSNFSGGSLDGIAMLMTHSDDYSFVNRYRGDYPNIGVGVDESNITPLELQALFTGNQKNFTYADGIVTFLNKPGVFKNITDAQICQAWYEPDSFKLIYTWVLSNEASMRKYLNTYIDGIFVEPAFVEKLHRLIMGEPYKSVYELAQNGYNPFSAVLIPKYILEVKTADQHLAGTDADILFTLTGNSGSLKSLPFNGNTDTLERGSVTWVVIPGEVAGEIKSLTLELVSRGLSPGWLPESITIHNRITGTKTIFHFGDGEKQEWLTPEKKVLTKWV